MPRTAVFDIGELVTYAGSRRVYRIEDFEHNADGTTVYKIASVSKGRSPQLLYSMREDALRAAPAAQRTAMKRLARAEAKVIARRLPKPAGHFVAVDPGTTYHGWAWFAPDGLCACGYAPTILPRDSLRALPCVIEQPIVYPHGTKNPPTIAKLAFSAGITAGKFAHAYAVEPRQWKGTTDGAAFLERIKRAILKRSEAERRTVHDALAKLPKAQHEHVIDAIGLGLVILGVKV